MISQLNWELLLSCINSFCSSGLVERMNQSILALQEDEWFDALQTSEGSLIKLVPFVYCDDFFSRGR